MQEMILNDIHINVLELKKAAMILRAINHKLRQEILLLILGKETITVTEIYVKLRVEQSVASQHLSILRKAGFVKTNRQGKFIFYSINFERIAEVNEFIKNLLN